MRVLVQRAKDAFVTVQNQTVGSIYYGLVLFVAFHPEDTEETLDWMVRKVLHLRIFPDNDEKGNQSLLDVQGEILSVSQFTLYGDTRKGNRPSYIQALNTDKARVWYDLWNQKLKEYVPVSTGKFGSSMEVQLTNLGPTTLLLER